MFSAWTKRSYAVDPYGEEPGRLTGLFAFWGIGERGARRVRRLGVRSFGELGAVCDGAYLLAIPPHDDG